MTPVALVTLDEWLTWMARGAERRILEEQLRMRLLLEPVGVRQLEPVAGVAELLLVARGAVEGVRLGGLRV